MRPAEFHAVAGALLADATRCVSGPHYGLTRGAFPRRRGIGTDICVCCLDCIGDTKDPLFGQNAADMHPVDWNTMCMSNSRNSRPDLGEPPLFRIRHQRYDITDR